MTTEHRDKSFKAINAALSGFREQYRARYIAAYTSRLDGLKARLEDANWDILKVHPYPTYAGLSRKAYAQAKNDYTWSRSVTEELPLGKDPVADKQYGEGTNRKWYRIRNNNDPYYVQMKQSAYDNARGQAVRDADYSIDSYIRKLVGKIDRDVLSARYDGELWFGSLLTVTCINGEQQVWKTKCILNVSCLGNVFNQWPTRKVS